MKNIIKFILVLLLLTGCDKLSEFIDKESSHAGLHCLVGKAHDANCDDIAQLILDTKYERVGMNFIIGGGFGNDAGRLNHYVNFLSQGGRKLLLELYVTNGASPRGYQSTPVKGLGTQTKPEDFRWQVQHDPTVREAYKNNIKRYKTAYESLLKLGGKLVLVPQLEDNLDDAAFNALVALTREAWHETGVHDLPMQITRNPCVGCYAGNMGGIPANVNVEHHRPHEWTYKDSIATNDGVEIIINGETTTYPRVSRLADMPQSKDNAFILWCGKCQGLGSDAGADVNGRNYHRYSSVERQIVLDYLKNPTYANSARLGRTQLFPPRVDGGA